MTQTAHKRVIHLAEYGTNLKGQELTNSPIVNLYNGGGNNNNQNNNGQQNGGQQNNGQQNNNGQQQQQSNNNGRQTNGQNKAN